MNFRGKNKQRLSKIQNVGDWSQITELLIEY